MFRIALRVALLAALVLAFAAAADTARALSPAQTRPEGVVALLRPALDQYWSSAFGPAFIPPKLTWYTAPARLCGELVGPDNSFFCPADNTIYLDSNWHRKLIARRGDFASAFVLAHEYGHAVQLQRGFFDWAGTNRLFAARELQADCYAGVFARWEFDRGVVSAADLSVALGWLDANGDRLSWDELAAHGTGSMRIAWFQYGVAHPTPVACDLVYRRVYGGRVHAPAAKATTKPKPPRRSRR